MDTMPASVRVNDLGQLETDRPAKAAATLALPAIVLTAHAVAAWLVLG